MDVGLGPKWIADLSKSLFRIRKERAKEINRLNDRFGGVDPEVLARRYIEPDVQYHNPIEHRGGPPPSSAMPRPLREWVNRFLDGELEKKDGRHLLFLLGDAGMGKTSALLMLKLSHLVQFWPSIYDFQLFKLGPETLGEIEALENKRKTVLLLDSLDEDPEAIGGGRLEARLLDLIEKTKLFRQVVITCRTQFFPKVGSTTIDGASVEVQNYNCNLLYLSPFQSDKVREYLRKVYPNRGWRRFMEWLGRGDNPRFEQAEALVSNMHELRMRPLLLSYIEDLMKNPELAQAPEETVVWKIYDALIGEWLKREVRKSSFRKASSNLERPPTKDDLRLACRRLALEMMEGGMQEVSKEDLHDFLQTAEIESLTAMDLGGRSLLNKNSDEAFRFAHRTVQEFLVVEHLCERIGRGEVTRPIVGTDETFRFYRALSRIETDLPSCSALMQSPQPWRQVYTEENGLVDLWAEIPAGEGRVGSPKGEKDRQDAEGPRHRIEVLQPFWISTVPITNVLYAEFDAEHADLDKPDHPVVNVTWDEAMAFCRWLAEERGFAGARLPTEEEWEYACRAGTTTRYWKGDAESDLAAVGWYDKNSGGSTHPVGEKPANPWGLYDVHGNVWEWTSTAWDAERYRGRSESKPFPVDPSVHPEDLAEPRAGRVVRGGSFILSAGGARSAFRDRLDPWVRWRSRGFRVLLPRPPAGGRS